MFSTSNVSIKTFTRAVVRIVHMWARLSRINSRVCGVVFIHQFQKYPMSLSRKLVASPALNEATPPAPVPAPSAQNGVRISQSATPCGPGLPTRSESLPALVQEASASVHSL